MFYRWVPARIRSLAKIDPPSLLQVWAQISKLMLNSFIGKPITDIRNITLGVSDDQGFAFSTTVIAYPRPRYVVLFGNTTNNNGIWDSMTVNAVNNFTVHLNKTTVKQVDYGTYRLNITNFFGGSTVYVNVVPESK